MYTTIEMGAKNSAPYKVVEALETTKLDGAIYPFETLRDPLS